MSSEHPVQSNDDLRVIVKRVSDKVKQLFGREEDPCVVVSPYRMNPLGAHVDHQGGSVLARTIDQYTVLAFYPLQSRRIVLHSYSGQGADEATAFEIGKNESDKNWERYAMASAASVDSAKPLSNGFSGLVFGSLVGAGLSSSASVILAYICALTHSNKLYFDNVEMVELARRVENDYMGLNNGIQDQMSVVFGQSDALSMLKMSSVTAEYLPDAATVDEVCWVVCYSGYSRELVSSGFNDRVAECREAAVLLDSSASILGDVSPELRTVENLAKLPEHLQLRAKHVYSEMDRVQRGGDAWRNGDWGAFGQLMNESCASSIYQYQCGSEPMIDLHNIALQQPKVYGSRFGGGGYGGCLMMLASRQYANDIMQSVMSEYLRKHPEKRNIARAFIAKAEGQVRIL